jgi:integrase
MPKVAKELGPLDVKRLGHPGGGGNATFAVGGVAGLMLQITPAGGRSWIIRTKVGVKRRELGLGGYPEVTLAIARDRAREAKDKVRRGIDPAEERKAARAALAAAQARGLTFKDAADKCLAAKLKKFKNPKHRQQWENTLATYATPIIGAMLVSEITREDILRVLRPIWDDITDTASRLRGRIEAVLSWATVNGHRSGDNPARWKGNLDHDLTSPSDVDEGESHHPAVQLDDAARWFAEVRKRKGTGSRALELLALTACRSGDVRGAVWDEIDLDRALWTIPAARMKAPREHRVTLCPAAVALLKALPRLKDNPLVFPAPRGGELSDMTLSAAMKRIHEAETESGRVGFIDGASKRPAVPHGLRSTFRDWVSDLTDYPGDMAELALAHKISDEVEAAYRRGHMVEKRRQMMTAWSDFLAGRNAKGKVVQLQAAR